MSDYSNWVFKFPRKRRAESVGGLSQGSARRLRRKSAEAVLHCEPRPAYATSSRPIGKDGSVGSSMSEQLVADVEKLAIRLAMGRTMQAWSLVASTRLFEFEYDDSVWTGESDFQPKRGLQATYKGSRVHILDTFTKSRVPHADVAKVSPSGDSWILGCVQQLSLIHI